MAHKEKSLHPAYHRMNLCKTDFQEINTSPVIQPPTSDLGNCSVPSSDAGLDSTSIYWSSWLIIYIQPCSQQGFFLTKCLLNSRKFWYLLSTKALNSNTGKDLPPGTFTSCRCLRAWNDLPPRFGNSVWGVAGGGISLVFREKRTNNPQAVIPPRIPSPRVRSESLSSW